MLTDPLANPTPYLDGLMFIVALAAILLAARSVRRARLTQALGIDSDLAKLPPTDCPWHLVGRHPNGKVWMWICADCEAMGPSVDHLAPRRCADFHGTLRNARRGNQDALPQDTPPLS